MKNTFFVIASVFCFLFAPGKYSHLFILLLSSLFILQTTFFLRKKSGNNYVNFHTIFFASFFLVNFFYPLVIYTFNPLYFPVFNLSFNEDLINKSTALALVTTSCFIFGASLKRNKVNTHVIPSCRVYYKHELATSLTALLFLIFVLTVGRQFLLGDFVAQSPLSLYILELLICMFTLTSILFFKNYNEQKNKLYFFSLLFFYLYLFLSIGDRGPALSIIIVSFCLYSFYVNKVSLGKVLVIACAGVLIMHIVGMGRTDAPAVSEGNILTRGAQSLESSENVLYDTTRGFVVNAWTLYAGVDYVEKYGVNYGVTFFKPIVSIVPFMQRVSEGAFGIKLQTSAEFFTELALGDDPTWGVGTNIVADVYISFGLVGCIIIFFIMGYYIEKFREQSFYLGSIKYNVIYFTILSYSVILPRASMLSPIKLIVWTYFIFILLKGCGFLKAYKSREEVNE